MKRKKEIVPVISFGTHSSHDFIITSKEEMAAAFTTWIRRRVLRPHEYRRMEEFTPKMYGTMAAQYFIELLHAPKERKPRARARLRQKRRKM